MYSVKIVLCLFQVIVISEELEDNFMLGLAALLGGDFVFLPHGTKVHKVAPAGWHGDSKKYAVPSCTFTLYLRVKFFMPSLRGVRYVLLFCPYTCPTYIYKEREM
jgi:tyrosine-protein phosphatase non-receptor type 13 protein